MALNVSLLVVVASRDPALIAVAGGLVGNLIVALTAGRQALRSLAGRGQGQAPEGVSRQRGDGAEVRT